MPELLDHVDEVLSGGCIVQVFVVIRVSLGYTCARLVSFFFEGRGIGLYQARHSAVRNNEVLDYGQRRTICVERALVRTVAFPSVGTRSRSRTHRRHVPR